MDVNELKPGVIVRGPLLPEANFRTGMVRRADPCVTSHRYGVNKEIGDENETA